MEISNWREQFAETDNSKTFWQVVRKAQGRDTRKPIPPVHDSNGIILANDSDKAEAVNDYFASIGILLAEKFVHDSSAMTDQSLETLYRVTPTRSQIVLSEKQVKLSLTSIKRKTGGPDKINFPCETASPYDKQKW